MSVCQFPVEHFGVRGSNLRFGFGLYLNLNLLRGSGSGILLNLIPEPRFQIGFGPGLEGSGTGPWPVYRAIWIDQQVYIENTLKRFELLDANNTNTPLPAGIHLEKSEEPVALNTKTYYQQIIGMLIYAAIGTRPDIAFAAMRLS